MLERELRQLTVVAAVGAQRDGRTFDTGVAGRRAEQQEFERGHLGVDEGGDVHREPSRRGVARAVFDLQFEWVVTSWLRTEIEIAGPRRVVALLRDDRAGLRRVRHLRLLQAAVDGRQVRTCVEAGQAGRGLRDPHVIFTLDPEREPAATAEVDAAVRTRGLRHRHHRRLGVGNDQQRYVGEADLLCGVARLKPDEGRRTTRDARGTHLHVEALGDVEPRPGGREPIHACISGTTADGNHTVVIGHGGGHRHFSAFAVRRAGRRAVDGHDRRLVSRHLQRDLLFGGVASGVGRGGTQRERALRLRDGRVEGENPVQPVERRLGLRLRGATVERERGLLQRHVIGGRQLDDERATHEHTRSGERRAEADQRLLSVGLEHDAAGCRRGHPGRVGGHELQRRGARRTRELQFKQIRRELPRTDDRAVEFEFDFADGDVVNRARRDRQSCAHGMVRPRSRQEERDLRRLVALDGDRHLGSHANVAGRVVRAGRETVRTGCEQRWRKHGVRTDRARLCWHR